MKKFLSIIFLALITNAASSQVYQTVNVTTAGTLSNLASAYLNTVTNLTITGNIDARDMKTIRDNMPLLAVLDMSATSIKSYNGSEGTYSTSRSYRANELPQYSFHNTSTMISKTTLTSITLPTSITSIGYEAFRGCSGITALSFPPSLTTIGDYAFQSCTGIISLTFPNSITTLGWGAFFLCTSITGSLILPTALTSIGPSAFRSCSGITSLTLPTSISTIGSNAFSGCTSITSLISSNTTPPTLGTDAFLGISPSVVYVRSTGLAAYKAAVGWSSYNIVEFPPTTTNIAKAGTLSTIENSYLCIITDLTITGNIDARDLKCMRDQMPLLAFLNMSDATIQLYTGTEGTAGSTYTTYSANEMPSCSFYKSGYPKTSLTTLTLPNSLNTIGTSAFDGCSGLTSVSFPISLKSIGTGAFSNCTGITEFIIPQANQNLSSLNGVVFNKFQNSLILYPRGKQGAYFVPNTVDSIASDAFNGCISLTSFTLPPTLTTIGSNAFNSCTGITGHLTLPSSLTTIDYGAFSNCIGITYISLPSALTNIGSAFLGCSALIEFIVPETSQNFSCLNGVLFNKNQSTLISFPSGIKGSYVVPSSVTSIGIQAFNSCSGITSITLPSSLINIGLQAFSNCTGIKSIYCLNPMPPTLGLSAFSGVNPSVVYVPSYTEAAYKATIGWSSFNIIGITPAIVNISASGSLSTILNSYLSVITNLTITGNIDARDFKSMRDQMPLLANLDLSGVTIQSYTGSEGTSGSNSITYPAYEIPQYSFYNPNALAGKISLKSIIFPISLSSIGSSAFSSCTGIINITLPTALTSIGSYAFRDCTGIKIIYCINPSPPALSSFCYFGLTSVTDVFVLTDEAVITYKASDWYNYFSGTIIKKGSPNAIYNLSMSNLKIYNTSSGINIEGLGIGEMITLYTVNGVKLCTLKSDGTRIVLPSLPNAVYLVKITDRTFKVVL